MTTISHSFATRPMVLRLSTAAELMTRNPLSFGKSMPIYAAAVLLDKFGLAEAPMVDEFGRPEGFAVVRITDVLRHLLADDIGTQITRACALC